MNNDPTDQTRIDPIAGEAALLYLAAELERVQLVCAQTVGNLALAHAQNRELRAELSAAKTPRRRSPKHKT